MESRLGLGLERLDPDGSGHGGVLGGRDHFGDPGHPLFASEFTSERSGAGTTRPAPGPNRAEDLLAERFARGEIDEDEFRRRMALLREHR